MDDLTDRPDQQAPADYEAPAIEDLDTVEGPSVTAAGGVTIMKPPR